MRHDGGSARAPPSLMQPSSQARVESRFLALAPLFFIAREVPLLAETDFEEDQDQARGESSRHQDDREDFPRRSLDERGARTPRDDQRGGRPKRDDAQPRSHAFNGSAAGSVGAVPSASFTVPPRRSSSDPSRSL